MLLYWAKLLFPYYSLLFFPFLFFLSIGWYCGAGVFGLIGCTSLSLSLALPTFFNNNKIIILYCSTHFDVPRVLYRNLKQFTSSNGTQFNLRPFDSHLQTSSTSEIYTNLYIDYYLCKGKSKVMRCSR